MQDPGGTAVAALDGTGSQIWGFRPTLLSSDLEHLLTETLHGHIGGRSALLSSLEISAAKKIFEWWSRVWPVWNQGYLHPSPAVAVVSDLVCALELQKFQIWIPLGKNAHDGRVSNSPRVRRSSSSVHPCQCSCPSTVRASCPMQVHSLQRKPKFLQRQWSCHVDF